MRRAMVVRSPFIEVNAPIWLVFMAIYARFWEKNGLFRKKLGLIFVRFKNNVYLCTRKSEMVP